MVSPAREYDRKIRQNVLEVLQVCLRLGDVENAKLYGAESARLKKRIETYDYRAEDAQYALVAAMDKRWAALGV